MPKALIIPKGAPPASRLGTYASIAVSLLPLLLVLRVVEHLLVRRAQVVPPDAPWVIARGLQEDLLLTLWAAVPALFTVLMASRFPRLARVLHRALLVLVAVVGVALIQYFVIASVPLGGDLFGYALDDIVNTSRKTSGISWVAIFSAAGVALSAWVLSGIAMRRRLPSRVGGTLAIAAIGSVLFHGALRLHPRDFRSDTVYNLAINKTVYFVHQSLRLVVPEPVPKVAGPPLSGYPLLRPADTIDVLGPLLRQASAAPNIVLVLVEGLGRDFMGPDARYGGFTPFLDTLATRSLFWENYLATSGRTFGALPSLLGSLPYGTQGFMSLGAKMPAHHTLVDLLRSQGYTTRYFSGVNGQFDNIDGFMERQKVDLFVDQSAYPPGYKMMPAADGGPSWGYGDHEMFRRVLELTPRSAPGARLDVLQTVTTHEPFAPPDPEVWRAAFERRLAALRVSGSRRAEYQRHANIFAALLYVDESIRRFLTAYATRPDYERTLFVFVGDHRLIPVPQPTRLSRFHVPLIIHSPMVKAPRQMASISSHLDLAPSLLALLSSRYGLSFPDSVHWLGRGLDTAVAFRNVHELPLMRTKNRIEDYVDGTWFLSGDELFRIERDLTLRRSSSASARAALTEKLRRFRAVNQFVTTGDRLLPVPSAVLKAERQARSDDSAYARLGLGPMRAEQAFQIARARALGGRREEARVILRRILRESPSYHDARVLLGRTLAWDGRYGEARVTLNELARRAPQYVDGYVARASLQLWSGDPNGSLAIADSALARLTRTPGLLFARARALEALGQREQAVRALDELRLIAPNYDGAAKVRARLSR